MKIGSIRKNSRGNAMLLALMALMMLSLLGLAFLSVGMTSVTGARTDYLRAKSLEAADAGVERAISILRGAPAPDGSTDGSWRNHPSTDPGNHSLDSWLEGQLSDDGSSSYKICVRTAAGGDAKKIIVTSIGTVVVNGITSSRTVNVMLERNAENVSPWNNVIFAGVGQSGKSINGNVVMRGSVHLLGDGEPFTDIDHDNEWDDAEAYTDTNHNGQYDLGEPFVDKDGDLCRDAQEPFLDANGNGVRDPSLKVTDLADELSGTADVGNNYSGMSATLRNCIPMPPTVSYGGQTVESLSGKLRVKHGLVSLSGSATVGWGNSTSNTIKETMDGVYVSDGYSGNKGSANVYSDNGVNQDYDLGDGVVKFPTLSDPYPPYATYMDYLKDNSYNKSGAMDIGGTSFDVGDGKGHIKYDAATGEMNITGIVYVDGDISFSGGKIHKYTGSGTLVSTGNINVDCNVLPKTNFPVTDSLGLIAAHNMTVGGGAQLSVAAACYAQYQIYIPKQTELAGTCVSSYFNLKNVPHLYQVPALSSHLPPGMPGAEPIWVVTIGVKSWQDKGGTSLTQNRQ